MIRLPTATTLALAALIAASSGAGAAWAQTSATAVVKTGDGKDAGVGRRLRDAQQQESCLCVGRIIDDPGSEFTQLC